MILVVSGTNREGNLTSRVAARVVEILQGHESGPEVEMIDLVELPASLFTPQAYAAKPSEFQPCIDHVLACGGMLVVAPEYNGGIPGVLKYFIDMLPFPESFDGLPVAFVGLSAGRWGGLRTVEHLQQVFGYRNAHIFPGRVFFPAIQGKLDDSGELADPELLERLRVQVHGFLEFCGKLKG